MRRPAAGRRWWAAAGAALAGTAGLALWHWRPEGTDPGNLPVARHETRDIGFRPIVVSAGLALAGLAAMVGLALWIYPGTATDKSIQLPLPQFPQPALQDNVSADYETLHARQLEQLNGAYWLDRAHGVVHVPVRQAMEAVARDGIPDWPATRERRR